MNLIIHRGSNTIGGNCVELTTDKTRILIDFGMPLVNAQHEPFDSKSLTDKSVEDLKQLKILPDIKGLYKGEEKTVDAILISHSHMDHYGFLNYVNKDIPIYLSTGAQELIRISNMFTPMKIDDFNAQTINSKKSFSVGDIKVTPYLVDHSAFDALAFLIEAEGRKVFYSGDFRGHGRKSDLFKQMIKNPPPAIDCLLMEGSSLGRNDAIYPDEISVQKRIEQILQEAKNITFLFVASQNIDRLVSAYKACLKTNKTFVIDIYTAYILDRLRKVSKHIPQFNWKNVRVKFDKKQADTLAQKVSTQLLYHYNMRKIDIFEMKEKKNNIFMLARDNPNFPDILKGLENTQGAKIIYSLWEGYLTDKFKEYCANKGLDIERVHTSGHANVDDLKAFAAALKPKTLIPIHTFFADQYKELFDNVRILKDGEEMDLN